MVKSKLMLMQRTWPRAIASTRTRKADAEAVKYFLTVLVALAALVLSAVSTTLGR